MSNPNFTFGRTDDTKMDEKDCLNCRWSDEDQSGPHCRYCSLRKNWQPKIKKRKRKKNK